MLEKLPSAIGHALHNRRAGLDKIAYNQIDLRAGTDVLQVTSLSFGDHEAIPARFTADGEGSSPPLEWTGVLRPDHPVTVRPAAARRRLRSALVSASIARTATAADAATSQPRSGGGSCPS